MRAALLGAIAAAALVAVPGTEPAGAEGVASHCESYRSLCYWINWKRTTQTHFFGLWMQERYFSNYSLCVSAVGEKSTCRTFPVRQSSVHRPEWGSYVSWERNYPRQGPGPYRVSWLQGGHRLGPPLTFYMRLPSYCSPSGDVCYGIALSGPYSLKLTLAAKYFSRYRICVRPVGKANTCSSFRVRRTGAQWGGKVYWSHYFPRAPGRYRVTWLHGTSQIGPALNFTLPPLG
jgi:hypothetical protein